MKKQNRVIIGQTEIAGLPISAPEVSEGQVKTLVRWKNIKTSFVLEAWNAEKAQWLEVPLATFDRE